MPTAEAKQGALGFGADRLGLQTMGKLAAWAELRATGRGGAATADELIAFASVKAVTPAVLNAARTMADVTLADWKDYTAAYKAGAFPQLSKSSKKAAKDAA